MVALWQVSIRKTGTFGWRVLVVVQVHSSQRFYCGHCDSHFKTKEGLALHTKKNHSTSKIQTLLFFWDGSISLTWFDVGMSFQILESFSVTPVVRSLCSHPSSKVTRFSNTPRITMRRATCVIGSSKLKGCWLGTRTRITAQNASTCVIVSFFNVASNSWLLLEQFDFLSVALDFNQSTWCHFSVRNNVQNSQWHENAQKKTLQGRRFRWLCGSQKQNDSPSRRLFLSILWKSVQGQ